ncbi:MAG: wax ester/triacylglycerol synthase family O-acyltransferase [Acidimicrobiales bacterium]|jgi:WS/DGAT/MGAT family acyltransferase
MERLGPLDASFLFLEDGITHMHIASCAVFAGPPPDYEEVVAAMSAKLGQVPRYRQVVRFVPFELARPVWADDPHFNLEYHVRHTALPAPGGPAELRHLMGRIMSQELDRRRPLWEAWIIEGLEGDRWGLISKIHHCMADGVSGTDLLAVMLDREPGAHPAPADAWIPQPAPSNLHLAADALVDLAVSPYEQFQAVRRVLQAPGRAVTQLRELADGVGSYARRFAPTEPSSIVGNIGPNRRWTWASAELDDLKAIRRSFGGTVNDAILAVIAGGFRELLLGRGEPVDKIVVRSLVPVSVRREEEHGTYNNRVSALFADLPVAVDDPLERLASIRKQMDDLKGSHQTLAGEGLTALGELTPFVGVALGERAAMALLRRVPQHSINTVTTNVPGPQFPLYLAGREMLEYLPFVPIAHGVRIGVAITSYNGRVAFGVTGDFDTTADIDVLAIGIEDGIAELLKLSK